MKFLFLFVITFNVLAQAGAQVWEKSRVFVLTDISNEPDDEESLVRFLVYANEYEVEGIVATTSTWLRQNPREDLIRRQLYAYGMVQPTLQIHANGFPDRDSLLKKVATGQPTYGMDAVGDGKETEGSRLLEHAIDRPDYRPLWVSIWGGANTLAQTLWDVKKKRTEKELNEFIAKIRVYAISDQDDAGAWLRKEFPELFYIVSPSSPDWLEYYKATWTGISGDRHYKNGPYYVFEMVDNPWLQEHIMSHGPLGSLYPPLAYIMEGDTPAFLGLIRNGLGWEKSPQYGGWGGRYDLFQVFGESRPIWTNTQRSRDCITLEDQTTHCSEQATIWRWRKYFQNDFAARMDWSITPDFNKANHNPIAALNGDVTGKVVEIKARPGEQIQLSSAGSSDPDRDAISSFWTIYPEAGTEGCRGTLSAEEGGKVLLTVDPASIKGDIHVILRIEDTGIPVLVAYRRVIIHIEP